MTAIEDYALIGNRQTAALVSREGSVDWLCVPRFDTEACLSALLGKPEHGRWLIRPSGTVKSRHRSYLPGTLILTTDYTTPGGSARVIDFMPTHNDTIDVIRIVEGVEGEVPFEAEISLRFDYGRLNPWVRCEPDELRAVGGPHMVRLCGTVPLTGTSTGATARFTVKGGQRVSFVLNWHPSHELIPPCALAEEALEETRAWWQEWISHSTYRGPWREAVERSLITLKALQYAPTGGIVAAPTTSLPEAIGGPRNWDYRFCWLRDATFTLYSLMSAGYVTEAAAWREWLLRAVAGDPRDMQIMYGIAGEHRLSEFELPWLPGYEGSRPVRVGNAAHHQFQLDVYGEVMDSFHYARRSGLEPLQAAWDLERALLDFLESAWREADEGIWEVRGPRRHFTHSKVMAWVAFDRGVKAVERFGLGGEARKWHGIREAIRNDILENGYDKKRESFVQYYGATELDASLLMIPLVGFLPATDPRMAGTIRAVEEDLMEHGFVRRYRPLHELDGLKGSEGTFLACSFWLADNYVLQGRHAEARALFERLLSIRNDLGLLAEQYDPRQKRLLGNFPQAFSHVALINTALNLSKDTGPAKDRKRSDRDTIHDV